MPKLLKQENEGEEFDTLMQKNIDKATKIAEVLQNEQNASPKQNFPLNSKI